MSNTRLKYVTRYIYDLYLLIKTILLLCLCYHAESLKCKIQCFLYFRLFFCRMDLVYELNLIMMIIALTYCYRPSFVFDLFVGLSVGLSVVGNERVLWKNG